MGSLQEIREPLLKSEEGESENGDVSGLDSLNYDVLENDIYRQNWRLSSRWEIIQFTICKWMLAFLVGLLTGLASLGINIAVENIAGHRYLATVTQLDSSSSFGLVKAFVVYSSSNIALVLLSALLCVFVAPAAAGSGVPEVEAYLNGVDCSNALRLNNLIVKALGIIGVLSSGLMCGKAGPLVHMGACIAYFLARPHGFQKVKVLGLLDNDKHRQDLVTCGAAAGLAAAFRAPVGGVLFALEETSSWWRSSLLWRAFFTTAVVAFVLRTGTEWCRSGNCGIYGKGGLILFDVSDAQPAYGLLELIPVAIIGIVGGTLGSLYNHLHAHFFLFNTKWQSRAGPFLKLGHAALVAFITSLCSFWLPLLATCKKCPDDPAIECPTKGRVGNYKLFNCPDNHYNDLAGLIFNTTEDAIRNLFRSGTAYEYNYATLLIFTLTSYLLALMTYGILAPTGLFVPAILCGATYGRLAGMVSVSVLGPHKLDESMYAVIGAASFLGGSMRMTVSLCVVMLELTNNLILLPLVMSVLLVSKIVGDMFNNGIFKLHIDMKGFHFLKEAPPAFMSQLTARDAVSSACVNLYREEKVSRVLEVLSTCDHNAFPVLEKSMSGRDVFFGLVLRHHLVELLKKQQQQPYANGNFHLATEEPHLDLTSVVNESPYTVLDIMSLSKTYSLFRQLAMRHLCVLTKNSEASPVVGILTRHDFMHARLLQAKPQLRIS